MDLFWNQQLLDVLFEYPIRSERSEFSIHPRLARLGLQVVTTLRFLPPGGAMRAFEYHGDPGPGAARPALAPGRAALRRVRVPAHPGRHRPPALHPVPRDPVPPPAARSSLIVTAFTVAHSITLIAAAFGLAPAALWFPPLIETLIAVSILYMALENIVGSNVQRRWIIAFAFGLVHGFGFSFALQETLQFAGSHLVTSLLAFNVGVELGQLLVLVAARPAAELPVPPRRPRARRNDHPLGVRRAHRLALDARALRAC